MDEKKKEKAREREVLASFTEFSPGSVTDIPSPEVAAVVSSTEATGMFAAMPLTQQSADEMSQLLGLHRQQAPEIGDESVGRLKVNARKRDPNP